ncbi:2-oxoacid:acceptor oxidoreductase subunit alpha [Desulfoluna sp.]|uniref:2-oxoacid:acceptor oxidoreductase subunit alpha n=1 Tax=Desulfoluna sp. TaxID=2045199 RepID=UPI0026289CEA|nr:2-oxoacid:acceptor oxidoreductase subunit alpha [Desulfoluna sp.]
MTTSVDIVIEICGSAGEGTISAGEVMTRFMSSKGYEIVSFDSFPSEIRGFGKCVAHFRASTETVLAPGKYTDVLIALNDAHAITQLSGLRKNGVLIYDSKPPVCHEEDRSIAGWAEPGMTAYGIPMLELANKAAGNAKGRNMVAIGAVACLFGIAPEEMTAFIERRFKGKKPKIIESNIDSFLLGYEWTKTHVSKEDPYTFKGAEIVPPEGEKTIMNGNEAVAMAAMDSGLRLYAGYPITPATKIMEILSKRLGESGGVMIQTEDEISAAGNVVGAGFSGKRAMTATSGPGFALMGEMINLAVMAEVPAVIVNSQRGGPSTGLPTKMEQSDLSAAVNGGTGDSPRVVFAPRDVVDCYAITCLAFYIAEKYQTPVVILLDFYLSNSIRNIDKPVPPDAEMCSSNVFPADEALDDYERFKITESGISPRTLPGMPFGMFVDTGLEHNTYGKPVYDGENHLVMTEKRYRKFHTMQAELPPAVETGTEGEVEIGILSWGSSSGAAEEAVRKAQEKGQRIASFHCSVIYPLPEEALKAFSRRCRILVVAELNYTGQYANLIAPVLNREVRRLTLITGLPMASEDILEFIGTFKG